MRIVESVSGYLGLGGVGSAEGDILWQGGARVSVR